MATEDGSCAVGSFASSPIQRLARLAAVQDEAEFGQRLQEEAGVEDASFAAALRRSCGICARGAKLYPAARELVVSFNGGKDACVVLFLWMAAVLASVTNGDAPTQQSVVFFDSADEFPEIQAFVAWVVSSLGLHMIKIEQRSFRQGMEDVVKQGVRAIVMGQRLGDPFTPPAAFTPSTDGWPAFMRINPIIEWSYAHVWTFLRGFGLPYCELYDRGFTSLGSQKDTVPNPCLLRPDGSYSPAYALQDAVEERTGRTPKDTNGKVRRSSDASGSGFNLTPSAGLATAAAAQPLARTTSRGPAPRTAGIILVGDELLNDKVHEVNSRLLCAELRGRGIAVRLVEVVAGCAEAISSQVRRASGSYDLVFASSGIGPAHDDERTLTHVAGAFEQDLAEKALAERASRVASGARQGPEVVSISNVHVLPGAPGAFRRALEQAIADGLLGVPHPWATGSLEVDAQEREVSEALRRAASEFPDVMAGAYPSVAEQNGSEAASGRFTVDLAAMDKERLEGAKALLSTSLPVEASCGQRDG